MHKFNLIILKMCDGMIRKLLYFYNILKIKKDKPAVIRNALIVKLSAFGDALCLLPSVKYINDVKGDCVLYWITTSKTNPSQFIDCGIFKEIIVLQKNPIYVLYYLVRNLKFLSTMDLIIDCDQYYAVSELISVFGRSNSGFRTRLKGQIFDTKTDYDTILNEKINFLNLLCTSFKIPIPDTSNIFFTLPEILNNHKRSVALDNLISIIDSTDKLLVVVYPGSSLNASYRRWSPDNYLKVITKLNSRFLFIIAGGIDEIGLVPIFSSKIPLNHIWINKLSIKDWAWVFKNRANLFFGNDGGLFHLAESQALPAIMIFGPSLYSKWGSLNENSIAVERNLPCRPCLRNYDGIVPQKCMYTEVLCLKDIYVDEIVCLIDVSLAKSLKKY